MRGTGILPVYWRWRTLPEPSKCRILPVMAAPSAQETLQLAFQHHRSGQLPQAEAFCRQILAQQPDHPDALHLLGLIAHQAGRNDLAVDLIRRAIVLTPSNADAHNNLGLALKDLGRLDEAIAAHRQAIALDPTYPEAYSNLGVALKDRGQLDDAIAALRQAIGLNPNLPEAHNNLGNALRDKGQLDDAIAAYRRAVALRPGYPQAHGNLGIVLKDKGQLDEAIAAFQQAIALRPGYAQAYCNLGSALRGKGQLDGAIAALQQAIALKADYPEAYSNLGNALRDDGRLDDAIAAYRQAIALNPELAEAHGNLGIALKDGGRLDDAIAAYRRAMAIRPDYPEAHSNLLLAIHYHPGYDAQAIAEEHRRWDRQHAQPLKRFIQPHANDRSPERRLRIGYVSPDFRDHVVGRNLLPLFRHADRQQFEVICYAQVLRPDAMTGQFQQHADGWRSTVGLSDEQVAELIRGDRIDILVDLALHTPQNRLLVFARKPAPVQVSFAGYPESTGLSTIDYRLSDPYLDPQSPDDSIIRLPHSFWCYDPLESREVPINPLPALQSGFVTFGCLSNFCKINENVLALWASVLRQVEHSRLLLLSKQGSHRQRTLDFLNQEGVSPDRVEFIPPQPRRKYMELYHRIDLGLDTFPYNGHTTSLDSFWMGVPVVTLVGQTPVSRAGWCQLSNLGLPELAAHAPGEFASIAVKLAKDLPRLQELRQTLRQRMEQSPLMDATGFARGIEAAYRQIWRRWCMGPPA
jgi:predicted O-linked N-acetylglucosamine transferase (SPINDLY family)